MRHISETTDLNENNFEITSSSVAKMVIQIRTKQWAIKLFQDFLHQQIKTALRAETEKEAPRTNEEISTLIKENMIKWLGQIEGANSVFNSIRKEILGLEKETVSKPLIEYVGYPITFNKTAVQLGVALDCVKARGTDIINDLMQDKFSLHTTGLQDSLYNGIEAQLPELGAMDSFWGNENSSVASMLLWSVAHSLDITIDPEHVKGAGAFYPFCSNEFSIKELPDNPFISTDGLVLFGDYQLGGHRYFETQHPLLPEDCSSAVAKATGLDDDLVKKIYTRAIKTEPGKFNYELITFSEGEKNLDFEEIQPGDIYLRGAHVAIISEVKAKEIGAEIKALEFNREIDTSNILGGGTSSYDLLKDDAIILREIGAPQVNSIPLPEMLAQIDAPMQQFADHSIHNSEELEVCFSELTTMSNTVMDEICSC
jgi:hypothetical protein